VNNTEETVDALVAGVTKIANHKQLVDRLEQNVRYHDTITEHQTRRVLLAYAMLVGENNGKDKAT
jgi:hypothetical protein